MEFAVDDVVLAITSLTSQRPKDIIETNNYLTAFRLDHSVWPISLTILQNTNVPIAVCLFVLETLKMKLNFDFESIKTSAHFVSNLKSTLYELAKRFVSSKSTLKLSALCISSLVIQSQHYNFIEEIIHIFSDSYENVATSFKILQNIINIFMEKEIIPNSKETIIKKLEKEGYKVLAFLNIWATNINNNKILEGTKVISKRKFTLRVILYIIIVT